MISNQRNVRDYRLPKTSDVAAKGLIKHLGPGWQKLSPRRKSCAVVGKQRLVSYDHADELVKVDVSIGEEHHRFVQGRSWHRSGSMW
jgi:hypothetical protein